MLARTLRDLLYGLFLVLWNLAKVLAILSVVILFLYRLIAWDVGDR